MENHVIHQNDENNYIDHSKEYISRVIKNEMKKSKLSIRKVANKINTLHFTQIHRITRCENYNIDTLLKILNALNLEITIQEKKE